MNRTKSGSVPAEFLSEIINVTNLSSASGQRASSFSSPSPSTKHSTPFSTPPVDSNSREASGEYVNLTDYMTRGGRGEEKDCIDVNLFLLQHRNDYTEYNEVRILFAVGYMIVFFLGIIGNLSMTLSIGRVQGKGGRSWTVANIFLVNLGVSDLLLCLTAIPLTPAQILYKIWYFGWFMCNFTSFAQAVSVLISSLSLCSIAADRYWSIVDTSRARVSRKWALLTVFLMWSVAFLFNLPLFLSMELSELAGKNYRFCGEFCEESEWPTLHLRKSYGTLMLVVQFLIPLILLTYCYWRILVKVRKDMVVDSYGMFTDEQQKKAIARKRRVTNILILMVAAFVISWFPLTIINIFADYGIPLGPFYEQQVYLVHIIAHLIAMTSVIWNPILYFWMSQHNNSSHHHGGIHQGAVMLAAANTTKNSEARTERSYFDASFDGGGSPAALMTRGKRRRNWWFGSFVNRAQHCRPGERNTDTNGFGDVSGGSRGWSSSTGKPLLFHNNQNNHHRTLLNGGRLHSQPTTFTRPSSKQLTTGTIMEATSSSEEDKSSFRRHSSLVIKNNHGKQWIDATKPSVAEEKAPL